ncbi:terpene synthase family protein [Actinomadura rubrisoli]|uniref:Uncharacterized protein n=1 Tax=Actinomadura rubrisoli TaxID=2530368 RepID=A0A4R5BLQ2_9ACTN|nr:hypothetical protein [Actinomadura rubrisoli]TDD86709.1 hypothetical protein E1298_17085 [Actinomadura rubrisoli]
MYQNTEFALPFPPVDLPDLTDARRRHLHWVRRFGLLREAEAFRKYETWALDAAAVLFHPQPVGAERDLGIDFYGWMIFWDGRFDGPLGQDPGAAAQVVDQVLGVVRHRPPGGLPPGSLAPIAQALQDLWCRQTTGMSPEWREWAAENWAAYLSAHLEGVRPTYAGNPQRVDLVGALAAVVGVVNVTRCAIRAQGGGTGHPR